MYLFLSILFYLGPGLLALFLARKQPEKVMMAWTLGTQGVVLVGGLLVRPALLYLSWGMTPTLISVLTFWQGDGIMGLFVPVTATVVIMMAAAALSQHRKNALT